MANRTDELVERRARALVQHQQVMAEADQVARAAAQARRRALAAPVFAQTPTAATGPMRQRVQWIRAS